MKYLFLNEITFPSQISPIQVVSETDLKFFDHIAQHLPLVRSSFRYVYLPTDTIPLLAEVLNKNLSQFYSYHGSTCYSMNTKDVVWFDFISPIEVGVDFVSFVKFEIASHISFFIISLQVQQVGYLEHKGGTLLIKKLVTQRPPQGIVYKSFGSRGVSQSRISIPTLILNIAILVKMSV